MRVEKLELAEIRAELEGCRKCSLCEGRTNIVFGEGDPHARVMIIGEAPGKKEDELGRPFVGASGKFLNELLEHAGLKREEVFIANVLKCRPPSNRNPQAAEIEACSPYLRQQTRSIDPDLIVTMGNFATQFILRTGVGITRLRGTWQRAGKFTVMPIFHPAAAIYDRSKRDVLFSDFELIGKYVHDKIAADEQNQQADAGSCDAAPRSSKE
ncbi:MAG: uracil-DNA glycosylase [Coriobacteriia bacterium]|nr:uracil-DNA glycosylase [Coriobacteriia bacterium]